MNPIDILIELYKPPSKSFDIILQHGKLVSKKAIQVAKRLKHLNPDYDFIYEAAMLHDIGICMTNIQIFGGNGKYPYICHGILGREILEKRNLFKHALVCERHIGVGITIDDIEKLSLPLPKREMVPISLEEEIICYADKFFSKDMNTIFVKKDIDDIKRDFEKFGADKVAKFKFWVDKFDRDNSFKPNVLNLDLHD